MSAFKNFFQKDNFYLTEQEKVNLQVLSNITKAKDGIVAMITNPIGERGLAVVVKDYLENKQLINEDLLSGVMTGRNKRIKEIYNWLCINEITKKFPPEESLI